MSTAKPNPESAAGNDTANITDATTSTKPKAKLNVHKFPRPPLCERTDRALLIKWGDKVVAETKPGEAYWVLETTHPPSKFQRDQTIIIAFTTRGTVHAVLLPDPLS